MLLLFIVFELIAQGYLVFHFYKLKNKLEEFVNKKILIFKILLVSILILVAFLSLPTLVTKGKHILNICLSGTILLGLFFLFTFKIFWRRTT